MAEVDIIFWLLHAREDAYSGILDLGLLSSSSEPCSLLVLDILTALNSTKTLSATIFP